MKNYRLYLIRHGLTDGNREGRYIGSTDLPLSEEGKIQLTRLAGEEEYPWVQTVYASPMKRCVETAELLYPDTMIVPVENLREYDFGQFEGRRAEELKDDPAFCRWVENAMTEAPPGGEEKSAFDLRISLGLGEIIKDMMTRNITDAAVVTHGGVIMGLLSMYGLPQRSPLDWSVENGRGFTAVTSSYLWGSGQVMEVMDPIPYSKEEPDYLDYSLIDLEEESGEWE